MELPNEEYLYRNEEEGYKPVVTAEDVLKEFITACRDDWSGYGARLWAQARLNVLLKEKAK